MFYRELIHEMLILAQLGSTKVKVLTLAKTVAVLACSPVLATAICYPLNSLIALGVQARRQGALRGAHATPPPQEPNRSA